MRETSTSEADHERALQRAQTLAPVGKSAKSHKRILRLTVFALFASIMAMLASGAGWLLWFDNALSDRLIFHKKTATSGKVVLVVVDDETIRKTGRFPFDRGQLAQALEVIRQGGAQRLYLDIALSHVQDASSDLALENALARFEPQAISLPITRTISVGRAVTTVTPLERFAQNTALTSFDGVIDSDGRVRMFSPPQIKGYPSTQSWLKNSKSLQGSESLLLDFSIRIENIPRISMLAVAEGRIKAEVFKDKLVIFGTVAEAAGGKMFTPQGNLTRVELLAIATETALKESAIWRLSLIERLALVLGIATLLGLSFLNASILLTSTISPFLAIAWGLIADFIFTKFGLILPLLPIIIVILIFWQRALLNSGAGIGSIRRLRNSLFGVDKSTLLIALDAMPDAAILFDDQGKILGQNGPFQAIAADYVPEGKSCTQLSDLFAEESRLILADPSGSAAKTVIVKAQPRTGAARYFEVFPRRLDSATGHIGIAGLKDITARIMREEELVTLAFRDALTGLSNRLAFQARLEAQCTNPDKAQFSVLLLDLDGFKKVNDTLGHDAGDQLLCGVANRLSRLIPSHGIIARLGGDEFAIMMPYGSQGEIRDLAMNIHRALQPVFPIDGQEARVGTSIGIAYAPRDGLDARLLTKRADAAMYRAKRNKPSSCEFDDRFDGETPGAHIRAQAR